MAKNYTKGKSIKPQSNKVESSIRKYTYIGEGSFYYKGEIYKKGAEFLLTEDEFDKHFKVFNLFK
jgi:hypothetical protein